MCNLYRLETSQQAMVRLFAVVNDRLGNMPIYDGIYPDQQAPVVHQDAGGRAVANMRWGFPPPQNVKRPVTNVRNLSSPFWRSWLDRPEHRCLIPATAFCEYEGERGAKRKRWFTVPDGAPDGLFAFAGIWREWQGARGAEEGTFRLFSMLTTEPNELVEPIHPKAMPVILDGPEAWAAWLNDPWDEAKVQARPFPADRMALEDVGDGSNGEDLPLFAS